MMMPPMLIKQSQPEPTHDEQAARPSQQEEALQNKDTGGNGGATAKVAPAKKLRTPSLDVDRVARL